MMPKGEVPSRSEQEPDECCAIIDKKGCGPWSTLFLSYWFVLL